MDLDVALTRVVGTKTAAALARLQVHTARDLLLHVPRRYARRGELTDLRSLRDGDHVTVLAEVVSAESIEFKPKNSTKPLPRGRRPTREEIVVTDGRDELLLVFFRSHFRAKQLVPGVRGLFGGQVSTFRGRRQLLHPEMELLPPERALIGVDAAQAFAAAVIPIYPATRGLPSWQIARAVDTILDQAQAGLADFLPADLLARRRLPGRVEALRLVHRPESFDDTHRGRARLVFDEAFLLQVELARRRLDARALPARPRPGRRAGLLDAFDARLPFTLTAGQRDVGAEIAADLAAEHPMHRLLQGEVGSGKTVVAVRAMLAVVDSGGQAVLLAPTEVLAQQHHRSVCGLLGPLAEHGLLGGSDVGTRVALLTGSMGSAARRDALALAASGEAGIVVGTHALLQERVQFADLGLVVVDEQHRFGVEQRAALAERGATRDGEALRPHVLVMTATPIPRTVAMTVFGDLETSSLREVPAGRGDVTTHVVPADRPHYVARVWQRVQEEVAAGRQVYVVCPRIGGDPADEDSAANPDAPDPDDTGAGEPGTAKASGARLPRGAAVLDVAAELAAGPLAGLRVEALHGRLPSDEKDDVMGRFTAAETDVLVATTVVEVGLDVANATTMVILDAERFGVSQLHQLRGRVGRGRAAGLCLLVTSSPEGSRTRQRLEQVAATRDGFALAQVDLEHRREGDVLGVTQSGRRSSLRLLSVLRDGAVIEAARQEATALVQDDPDLTRHPAMTDELAAMVGDERAEFLDKA